MSVLNYWPLAFLILIPIIIVMYLLKQKAVDHSFASLYLWKETYRNMEADTPWEKLKKNWLMILQILLTLLMIFALMAPYLKTGGEGNRNIVLIIDNSAGMNMMMLDEGKSRLEVAKDEAEDYIDDLPYGSGITILTSAADANLVVTECTEKSQAIHRLREIEGTCLEGDGKPAVDLVRSMQNQWESSEIVLFTDTYTNMGDLNGYIVRMDSASDNIAVEYLSYTESPHGLKVLVRVYNHGKVSQTADINLYGDDNLLSVKEVSVEAESSNVVYFENISFSGEVLSAEINGEDALMEDNRYETVLSDDSECRILMITDANVYLEKAISLIDGVSITKTDSVESFSSLEEEDFDFYVFDGIIPEELPDNGSVMLLNCVYPEYAEAESEVGNSLVAANEESVTRYAESVSFAVSEAMILKVPVWADSFLETEQGSVGYIGQKDGQMVCVLGFDLHNSDFPLKTEFPVLIYNIVNECAATGMLSSRSIEAGKTIRISGKNNGDFPMVLFPDGSEKQEPALLNQETETEQLGIYTVTQETDDGKLTEKFSVHFPASESGSRFEQPAEDADETSAPTEVATSAGGAKDLTPYLIGLILLVLFAEWIVYLKR